MNPTMKHLPTHQLPSLVLLLTLGLLLGGCRTTQDAAKQAAEVRWAGELAVFDRADAVTPPVPGAMLFVGSSSFRLWTNLAAAFPERRVVNRGFGGSQMHELLALMDRLVWPYAAKEIFVYEGDNDLANGKEPAQVAREFREFARRVHGRQPKSTIYFVAVKPSPKRAHLLGKVGETNRLIEEFCGGKSWLKFIDVATPMLNGQGQPRPELFGPDDLHLNGEGYALWRKIIRAELGLESK